MNRTPFVTRERELLELNGHLDSALMAQGLVCFVAGEAGSGKTALVGEFARRAQVQHNDLVIAFGQSDAQTGLGDPYLPFREILAQLTGDVDAKLSQGAITEENASRLRKLLVFSGRAIVEVGPDLIDIFVPWVGLATRAAAFAAEKVGWLERLEALADKTKKSDEELSRSAIQQEHIFEQYTNVLTRLSEKRPLLLVLDDLHWSDAGSIDLLFRLGRRIGGSRIFIVGTYRPEEVALGRGAERHPMEKVLAEMKRYFGDTCIDLDAAQEIGGRRFVDALLDTEPNQLGEVFRQALYHHTHGHPLFTIELLRDMQERGDLILNEAGRWIEGPALDWETFPARVEGVIEERIGRLEEELREALTVASVEGENFTAEVVARVRSTDERGLIQQLSRELDKRHRLVIAQGVQRLKEQRLSAFQFQHSLFQSYLYNELSDSERAYLHEDVGTVLEALYGDQAGNIAVQLARHFVEADLAEKAVPYLHLAGQQAVARYAYQEAQGYLTQALEMLPAIDGYTDLSEGEFMQRSEIHLERADVCATLGQREAWQEELVTLCQLAEALNDDLLRAKVSLREARYAETTGDYPAARQALEAAIDAARSVSDVNLEARAVRGIGFILWRKGDFKEAHIHLDVALELSRQAGLPNVEAGTLHSLAVVHWRLGEFEEAKSYARQALELGREIGDRLTVGQALNVLGNIHLSQGKFEAAKRYYEDDLRNNREIGSLRGEAMCLGNLGIIAEIQGDFAGAMSHYEQILPIFQDIGDRGSEARCWAHMAKNAVDQGVYDKGQVYYQRALDIYQEIDNQQGQGWVIMETAFLLNKLGDYEGAVAQSREALKITRESGARSMEAGAWTVFASALTHQGKLEGAADAYRKGLEIRRELDEQNVVMESLAGLAAVDLERGERSRAMDFVEQVLQYIEETPIEGTDEPLEIYLICYHVLQANRDARAGEVLRTAYELLQARAAKISDAAMQRSFLENIASHREIVRQFVKRS
jgi:predicted ATPase/Tfp pilus assembly protein PilF